MYSKRPFWGAGAILIAGLALPQAGAQTIPPSLAAPAGSVDTSKPGFRMRIVQGNSSTAMTGIGPAERLISGRVMDPATGLPLNNATPNPTDGSFIYDIPGVINMHEQVPSNPDITGGNFFFSAAAPHNVRDEAEPGIPGTTGSGDYFVMEFTGFLQLPAGTVRFGVNSDDGFKLTIGQGLNPRIQALQLIALNGTRGFGNTEANITVTTAGIYPFRLLYWENTGANSGVELFTFAPGSTSGSRYLINDLAQANAIKSYREAIGAPPSILTATPALTTYVDLQGNAGAVPPAPLIWVELMDGSSTVQSGSVTLSLDGVALTSQVTQDAGLTLVKAMAPTLAAGSVHTNTLVFADSAGKTYTNSWAFTVGNYSTIPAAYALSSVDTTKPGFRVKARQMAPNRNPSTGNVPNAERQIAGGYIDPATSLPYENTILTDWLDIDGVTVISSSDPSGFFTAPGLINWNTAVPTPVGNFSSASVPPMDDQTVPGLSGNTGPNAMERAVYSIETILELKAGPMRLGVNSDDGFRLSAGQGPGDVVGLQLGTAGDRSATDSYMDFVVAADGFYPFRLMWFQTGSGASCEFYVVDLATGAKTLINDLTGPTPIKAYWDSTASRPAITKVLPTVNYGYAFADQDLVIEVSDGASALDPSTVVLTLNGTAVTPEVSKSGKVTTLARRSSVANPLPSGANNVVLVYGYNDGTARLTTNSWSYNVPAYTRAIPAAAKVAASDVSGTGFRVRVHQLDRALSANQGNGGRYTGNNGGGANMPRPEIQLADGYINRTNNLPFANLAAPGPNPDGSYDIPEVINFNSAQSSNGPAANAGIFNSDTQVPGLPGSGTSNFGLDNTVHEFTAYLQLKAGAHIFGVNVDDGWLCLAAPNPRDTLGTVLGWRAAPGGQNGSPLHNPNAAFNVLVPEDGIYPIRLLFWQGGGGVNCEFLAIDRNTGTQVLVNDVNGFYPSVVANGGQLISSIAAYNTYTGPTRPWTKFSVYPMPTSSTLWQNIHQQSGPGPIQVKLGNTNPADIGNDEPRLDQALVNLPFGDAIGAVLSDLGSGTVGMVLDGQSVTPTVTPIPASADHLVMYVPNPPLASGSTHTAGLVYAGTTNYWTFKVINYVEVPAGIAAPANKADPSAVGFRAKIVQAQTAATLANTVARAEAQLLGTPASVALPGPEPDGTYVVPGVINWNVTKSPGGTPVDNGSFQALFTANADEAVPGIPGTGLAGNPRFENITAEIFAWLELPAGYQKFAVNGDDGWKVQIGQPGQTDGLVLFSRDRSGGARDIPFAFVVPEAGLYPVRLVYYQGNGGGNVEFFTYGPGNQKILVNDRTNPDAIKAYYRADVPPPAAPEITGITLSDGSVTIRWINGGVLESAPAAPGPWTSTGDLDGTFSEAAGGEAKFYRVKR